MTLPFSTSKELFINWSNTFTSLPTKTFYPKTEEEVIEIIQLAIKNGEEVRAIGGGLSPSDLCCTNGFLINTDNMNQVIEVDKENLRITVQAGIRLENLHPILSANDMAMPNLGSVSFQSVAGILGSAVHGTGISHGSLSTQLYSAVLIDGQAQRHFISKNDLDLTLYKAIQCHLGCLGIITKVTLQCVPSFNLEIQQNPNKLGSILNNLDELIKSNEYFRFWWFPHINQNIKIYNYKFIKDDCITWCADKTGKKPTPTPQPTILSNFIDKHLYQALLLLSKYLPSLTRSITQFYYNRNFSQIKPVIIQPSVKAFNFDCLFPQYVNEWSIPIENTKKAMESIHDLLNDNRNNLKGHFPVEVRFVDKDDSLIAPTQGRISCFIGIIIYRPFNYDIDYTHYWNQFEQIMLSLNGRPHWAKAHPLTLQQLHQAYPHLHKFLELRKILDPSDLFVNPYIKRHLIN